MHTITEQLSNIRQATYAYLSWNANEKDASSSTASTTTSLSMALMRDCTKDALFALYRNLSTNS
jgi:hypothetical protein